MAVRVLRQTKVTDALCDAFQRLIPQLSPHLVTPDSATLTRIVADPHTTLFVAENEDSGEIAGVLTLVCHEVASGSKAWIEDVVVDAPYRGQGIGKALVQTATEYAFQKGIERVMLTSSPQRETARALYKKMGFEEVKTSVFALKTDRK